MAEKRNMTDLCKEALEKLADTGDPKTLIQDAKETAGKKEKCAHKLVSNNGYGQKLQYPGFFHDVTEYKGWKIVQHKLSFHYVLLDSDNIVYAKYLEPNWYASNFKLFLEELISLAVKYPRKKSSMIIYQLVTNKKVEANKDCEGLTVSEAYNRFPHSKDLAIGFFTVNPFNDLSLIPIQNYFANIALNQDDECVVLLGKIGARSVHITKFDESKTENTANVKAGFEKVNAHVGASISSELQNFSELIVKFEGHISDISPDILKNSVWFQNNSRMNAILEGRLSKNNKVNEWDMTTRITQTFNFDFTAAANVLGVIEASLKNEYEKATKQLRKFHVIFGE